MSDDQTLTTGDTVNNENDADESSGDAMDIIGTVLGVGAFLLAAAVLVWKLRKRGDKSISQTIEQYFGCSDPEEDAPEAAETTIVVVHQGGPTTNRAQSNSISSSFTNPLFSRAAEDRSHRQSAQSGNSERNTAGTKSKARKKASANRSKPEQKSRMPMSNVPGWAVRDVGKPCIVRGVGSGIVRFVGLLDELNEPRVGVEMNKQKGNHNGTVGCRKYFECKDGHGLLTHPANVFMPKNSAAPRAVTIVRKRSETIQPVRIGSAESESSQRSIERQSSI